MAIKTHPDKNPGDPEAHIQFLLITKAYECLKNEETLKNCQKSGNPEGNSSSFSVGIALHPSLLKP